MLVLVVNAGSSSLKLSVLDQDRLCSARELSAPSLTIDSEELDDALCAEVLAGLRELAELAPLHQAKSLAALQAVSEARPDSPAVACFDTAFHATISAGAATYALPRSWRERWGLRRYGFHGLSHAYAARRAAELLDLAPQELRIVTCHLGAGASLAAVDRGRSVDTTMGFTPLEGLVMATRSGSVDPGLLLWLLERTELDAPRMAHALEHESGLLALSGTADMRAVIAAAQAGDAQACLALEVFVHRLRAGIAAMAAAMDGLDAVVWTGGVGEHAPAIRAAAADRLGFLGVRLDEERNRSAAGDVNVTGPGAAVQTLVITAREDLEIARQVTKVLS